MPHLQIVSQCIYLESLFNYLYINTKFDMTLNKNFWAAMFEQKYPILSKF